MAPYPLEQVCDRNPLQNAARVHRPVLQRDVPQVALRQIPRDAIEPLAKTGQPQNASSGTTRLALEREDDDLVANLELRRSWHVHSDAAELAAG